MSPRETGNKSDPAIANDRLSAIIDVPLMLRGSG